jgi:uncharacterized phage-associated protein
MATTSTAFDPRVIANAILDIADDYGYVITHLSLQKLLYFSHGLYLLEYKNPLVSGHFEAWENGPVHPLIYRAFRDSGRAPIRARTSAVDILTGLKRELPQVENQAVMAHLTRVVAFYGKLPAGRLVTISHAPRGPWAVTVNKARKSIALGMRITDVVTSECFRFQNVSVVSPDEVDEVYEDTPFTAHGSRSDRTATD